ncbi:MAG: DUF4403 family protein [Saprospiraceae bacterium]
MRQLSYPTFLLLLLLGISACGTKSLTRPTEKYNDLKARKNSVINIPIRLNMNELERSLNNAIGETIYEDDSMDSAEGLYIKAEKLADVKIKVDTQTIRYQLPISVQIKKDLGFTTVGANGEIELSFATDFTIEKDWQITTTTKVENYDWLKRPRLSFGGLKLPAKMIGDIIIQRSEAVLTKTIDDQIQQNVELRKYISEAWQQLQTPLEIAPEFSSWLVINPGSLKMSPLEGDGDYLTSNIIVEAQPEVLIGQQPVTSNSLQNPLPDFSYSDEVIDDFVLFLSTDIPYKEAKRIAHEELVGQVFEQGKYQVTIEDIDLYGQGEYLVVGAQLSGSYDGAVYLTGKPVYNKRKNSIDLEDLEFELSTKNFLARTAGWLLKSNIKKRIRENLDFLLDTNLNEIKKQIQTQLDDFAIAPNLNLQGKLKELNIQDVILTPTSIRVDVGLEGNLEVVLDPPADSSIIDN